jgi:glycosyltransferase involved in cell wall biosynthesis
MLRISFVIPAYNEAARIEGCLQAIQEELARTPCEAEIVVVNNASSDNTRELALAFSGVKVVDEPRKGLVQARQSGFEASAGDLVANIDADVLLPQGWLKRVLYEFDRAPGLVCLSGPFIYYDLSSYERALVKIFYFFAFLLYAVNRFVLGIGSMVQGGNFVLSRKALVAAGGYDTSISFYGEDTDVARRLNKVGAVKWTFTLPVYTSGRRIKGEGIVATSMRYTANYFWVTFFGKPFTRQYKDIRPE